jgi:hypothetical protein
MVTMIHLVNFSSKLIFKEKFQICLIWLKEAYPILDLRGLTGADSLKNSYSQLYFYKFLVFEENLV